MVCQVFSRAIDTPWRARPRQGALPFDPRRGRVKVVDLTSVASNDFTNHGKFASGEVVGAIGERLAEGQTLTDAKAGLVESLGAFTGGAINVAAGVATGAVAAPTEIFDPTKREKSVDTAAGATSLNQ